MFTPFFCSFSTVLEAEPKTALPSFSRTVFRCSMHFSLALRAHSWKGCNRLQSHSWMWFRFCSVISSRIVKMISIFEWRWFSWELRALLRYPWARYQILKCSHWGWTRLHPNAVTLKAAVLPDCNQLYCSVTESTPHRRGLSASSRLGH